MHTEGHGYELIKGRDWWPFLRMRRYRTTVEFQHHSVKLGVSIWIDQGKTFDGPTMVPVIGHRTRALMRAALFHDALYTPEGMVRVTSRGEPARLTRGQTDRLFDEIAKQDGANWLLRTAARYAIKWFGGLWWEDGVDGKY